MKMLARLYPFRFLMIKLFAKRVRSDTIGNIKPYWLAYRKISNYDYVMVMDSSYFTVGANHNETFKRCLGEKGIDYEVLWFGYSFYAVLLIKGEHWKMEWELSKTDMESLHLELELHYEGPLPKRVLWFNVK